MAHDPYADRPWIASYPSGVPADVDVPDVPVTRLLDDAASRFPSVRALTFLGAETTYRELRDQVDRFAGALATLGVSAGDRVALVLPNCPQFVVTLFSALRLGAVAVPLNPLGTTDELMRQFAETTPTVIVCLDKTLAAVEPARTRAGVEHVVVTSVLDFLPVVQRGWLRVPLARNRRRRAAMTTPLPPGSTVRRFVDVLRSAAPRSTQTEVDPANDAAVLIYTGGTSGIPRGAMLTHTNLVANAQQVRAWDVDAVPGREVTLAALPLSHAYGLTLCLTLTTLLAGTLVLLPRWNLGDALAAIDDFRPTLFPGVPPIYEALVASPKTRGHDLRSIRVCVSGAMRLPPETQELFEKVTGGRLVEGYGMTETAPVTHANPLDGRSRRGTVGLPLPGTRCRLVDPEDRSLVVPVGSPGELAVAGPQRFLGWYGEEPGDTFTPDGFYLTGDIAVMDEAGFFSIVDRKKEVIVSGGFNIYPLEVEEVLRTHPLVEDACVIGLPDRYRGETVRAAVVLKAGADADEVVAGLTTHCEQRLSTYKIPRAFDVRAELPRTPLGKIQRHVVKDAVKAEASGASVRQDGGS